MWKRFLLVLVLLPLANPAHGYVDISPTLGFIITDATAIVVLEVDKISIEKRVVVFKKIADLKGTTSPSAVRHHLAQGSHPREPRIVLDWAEPGKRAIAFANEKTAVVCLGEYWYECVARDDNWWAMTSGRPELALAYFGTSEKLRDAVTGILAGKEMVITAINHGAKFGVFQYENVAFHKALRGKDCPVFRIKASLEMPPTVWRVGAKDSKWVVGTGAYGTEDIPTLVEALKNPQAKVRAKAADDLGLMGWRAQATEPLLLKECEDPDPMVRISAARAVDLIGGDITVPVATLNEALMNENPIVRRAAATALGDLEADAKGAVAPLRDAMEDSDAGVRWAAAEALGRIGPGAADAVPVLALALRDAAVRPMAADALAGIGKAARGAVPLLLDGLKDTDVDYRWACAMALTQIDTKSAKAALPIFIEKLRSSDHRIRWDAMAYISPMRLDAKEAAPAVLVSVKRGNGVAAACLASIAGPEAIEALPVLLHVMADDWDTTGSIAQIGPAAVPQLFKLIENPKANNRHLAIKALGLLAPQAPQVLPTLIGSLKHADPAIRKAAVTALGQCKLPGKDAAILNQCLADVDPSIRLVAAKSLQAYGTESAGPAVPMLTALLKHSKAEIRRETALTLADFGPAAKPAMPNLLQAQKDADPNVRSAAAWAVARIAGADSNRQAVGILVGSLKDRDARVRQEAARLLGALGPDARDAIAPLGEARQDDDDDVRYFAAVALAKIQGR